MEKSDRKRWKVRGFDNVYKMRILCGKFLSDKVAVDGLVVPNFSRSRESSNRPLRVIATHREATKPSDREAESNIGTCRFYKENLIIPLFHFNFDFD